MLVIATLDGARAAHPSVPPERVNRDLEKVYAAGIERATAAGKPADATP